MGQRTLKRLRKEVRRELKPHISDEVKKVEDQYKLLLSSKPKYLPYPVYLWLLKFFFNVKPLQNNGRGGDFETLKR